MDNLLSNDPIGAFEKIKDNYLRYFNTMYRFSDQELEKRKKEIIDQDSNFYKEPYCELIPKYKSSGQSITDIYNNWNKTQSLPNDFNEFIEKGLMKYNPFQHQLEMLEKGYGEGKNVLITSGTGSGKTESFMLPLLASLLKEAQNWPAQPPHNPYWYKKRDNSGKYTVCQRENENRPAAIRALLLYPMNALVADQVARLRKALDSDDIRSFLDNKCNRNRIYFGSYNGDTLETKYTDIFDDKIQEMVNQCNIIKDAVKNQKCEEDDIYVSPRLNDSFTSEMIVREDMREKCPDIMITNISMLSIMLMRYAEQGMLDQTKDYYANNPDAIFHIVVDELHLQRGTAGAEVAYLLRMFLHRIGVPPMRNGKPNPQLRIYSSSASIENNPQSYLEDFFGIYNKTHNCFEIQEGYPVVPQINTSINLLDYNHFDVFNLNNRANKRYYEQDANEKQDTEQCFLDIIGFQGTFNDFVEVYSPNIYSDLLNISKKSFPISELKKLPGTPSDDAIRGFMIFRGAVNNDILPSIRFHQFYKYIEGLWGELQPDSMQQGPIGELSFQPKEVSSNSQHKMLELLRCECCGELFIGGNRKHLSPGKMGMSLNQPDLNKIPNMQSIPMVQRKSFDDYIVFWPTEKKALQQFLPKNSQEYERFGLVNIKDNHTRYEIGRDDAHGAWKEGYLNPYDGSVLDRVNPASKNEYIHGFYFFPRNTNGDSVNRFNNEKLKALPCKCPHCEKDYLNRKYVQSPIRSFRTGMGRNNQLLSKELLYNVSAKKGHDEKLIGFSDSRQDAAEQSKLISREHYRDIIRLLFIEIIKGKIEANISDDLNDTIEDIIDDINGNKDISKIISRRIEKGYISDQEKTELTLILQENISDKEKIERITNYKPNTSAIYLEKLISKDNAKIDGELVQKLLALGINPAGTSYADMYPFNIDEYWDKSYDFQSLMMIPAKCFNTINGVSYFNIIYNQLQCNIFKNCFGEYMNVNTEAAGLGYVYPKEITQDMTHIASLKTMLHNYIQNNNLNIEDIMSSCIRVYGDSYRYENDFETRNIQHYTDCNKRIKKFVHKLAIEANVNNEESLGQLMIEAMNEVATDTNGFLTINKPLRFKLAHENDQYYECKECHRIHLHRGTGFCTNTACQKELPKSPSGKVKDLWQNNYISYDIMIDQKKPKRLHSEELTGQTDNQTDRLLKFKDIIVDPTNNENANKIDMLCVTTTMEVGVDIGSLQAIYQGNMPPTRYNYQQRVGRAGRRGQAFSGAVTFCRGKSHDSYFYFNALDEITGGRVPDPNISVNPFIDNSFNSIIVKRIILKHILMLISANHFDWEIKSGTCGQLGGAKSDIADWNNDVRPIIKNWIDNNNKTIDDLIHYYLDQYLPNNSNYFDDIKKWVINDSINEMDTAIANDIKGDNAQAITEAGLLPMYGMPVDIRELYHGGRKIHEGFEYIEKYDRKIDRPLEQAITEFAPGAMKTKDSAEYYSAGLTIPLTQVKTCSNSNELNNNRNILDPLEYSYNLELDQNDNIISIRPFDPAAINGTDTYRLVIPKAFRTEKIINNKGKNDLNDDKKSNYYPLTTWVNATHHKSIPICKNGAGLWEVWNGKNSRGDVWYINHNNRLFFEGKRAYKINHYNNETSEPKFWRGQVNTQVQKDNLKDFAPNFMVDFSDNQWVVNDNSRERIALGAKKYTDIMSLTLDISKIPDCLNLNALSNNGRNRPAIIAALYSAATLIQRTFADKIDIQPEEMEISEVKIDAVTGLPSVYLNDKAPNGAGYISLLTSVDPTTNNLRLFDIMNDIVSDKPQSRFIQNLRNHKCRTSCPRCLNTFYNAGLHHVLDWRLGMDIIKLMVDSNYHMGYDDLNDTPYGDLKELFNTLGERIESSDSIVKYHKIDNCDWHDGYFETQNKKEHLVHPLWNTDEQESIDGYVPQNNFTLERSVKETPKETTLTAINVDTTQKKKKEDKKVAPQDIDRGVLG